MFHYMTIYDHMVSMERGYNILYINYRGNGSLSCSFPKIWAVIVAQPIKRVIFPKFYGYHLYIIWNNGTRKHFRHISTHLGTILYQNIIYILQKNGERPHPQVSPKFLEGVILSSKISSKSVKMGVRFPKSLFFLLLVNW